MAQYPETLTCDECGSPFVVRDAAEFDQAMSYVVCFLCPGCTEKCDQRYAEHCARSAGGRAHLDEIEAWATATPV